MRGGRGFGGGGGLRNPCLTMHQPWASLLVHGIKRVEGRSWPSPVTGRLWIHAASKVPDPDTVAAMEAFYREIHAVDGVTHIDFPHHYPVSRLLGKRRITRPSVRRLVIRKNAPGPYRNVTRPNPHYLFPNPSFSGHTRTTRAPGQARRSLLRLALGLPRCSASPPYIAADHSPPHAATALSRNATSAPPPWGAAREAAAEHRCGWPPRAPPRVGRRPAPLRVAAERPSSTLREERPPPSSMLREGRRPSWSTNRRRPPTLSTQHGGDHEGRGCVEVVGCVRSEELVCWEDVPESVRLEGLTDFCWLCENPQKLVVPFEMRGYQGVYNLEKKIFEGAVRGLLPVQGPLPVKFRLADPRNPFSLKPGSLNFESSKSTLVKTPSVSAAIAGARAAANQYSRKEHNAAVATSSEIQTRNKSRENCADDSSGSGSLPSVVQDTPSYSIRQDPSPIVQNSPSYSQNQNPPSVALKSPSYSQNRNPLPTVQNIASYSQNQNPVSIVGSIPIYSQSQNPPSIVHTIPSYLHNQIPVSIVGSIPIYSQGNIPPYLQNQNSLGNVQNSSSCSQNQNPSANVQNSPFFSHNRNLPSIVQNSPSYSHSHNPLPTVQSRRSYLQNHNPSFAVENSPSVLHNQNAEPRRSPRLQSEISSRRH